MTVSDVSTNNRQHTWVRWILVGTLLISAISWIGYVTMRMHTVYRNQLVILELRDHVKDLQSKLAFMEMENSDRFSTLESAVFADVKPKLQKQIQDGRKKSGPPESWTVNNLNELRKRVQQIQWQLWRLENERW